MKKLIAWICMIALCASCGMAAADGANILALKGPTAMGMVQMMADEDAPWNFEIVASTDEVAPAIVQGRADIAAVPANLAAVLYNNTEKEVQVLAINTLGVIYIVEQGETVQDVQDLRGRTIYASGKGASPEYALNYILRKNGMDPEKDVSIEWKSEHAECLAALLSDENAIAMLPQPFVTTAQMKSEGLRVCLDLTEEWDKLQAGSDAPSAMITGVVIGRKEFIEKHPDAVAEFLQDYAASVEFVNGDTAAAAALVGQFEIVPEAVALKAIPECNITFIAGEEMRQMLSGYLEVLMQQNPKAIGGAMPAEDFYFPG